MGSNPLQQSESGLSTLELETKGDEVAVTPGDTGDLPSIIAKKIPQDIRDRYEIHSYRNAAVVLAEAWQVESGENFDALRQCSLTKKMIRTAGGNESAIPKIFSGILRPKQWHETIVQADLPVKRTILPQRFE